LLKENAELKKGNMGEIATEVRVQKWPRISIYSDSKPVSGQIVPGVLTDLEKTDEVDEYIPHHQEYPFQRVPQPKEGPNQ
jgi:hypothetical protein